MFIKNKLGKKGQSFTEFIILAPVFCFFLLAVVKISVLALKAQKLEMAAYYAARVYSRRSIRGIEKGTALQLEEKKEDVMDTWIIPPVRAYLQTDDVVIFKGDGNKIHLEWPVEINFFDFSRTFTLKAEAEMDNEPLHYAGGRYASGKSKKN